MMGGQMEKEEFPLTELPKEVFENILSFLPGKDLLLVCSRVNREWKTAIESQSLWHLKCQRLEILFADLLHNHDGPFDFKQYYFKNPYTRNLLKNSKALEGVKYWSLTPLGDYYRNETMFIKEDQPHGSEPLHKFIGKDFGDIQNWVTSYIYSSREQMIDLIAEGCHSHILDHVRPPIVISEWYAARFDCGSEFDMEVKMFAENKEDLLDSHQFNCNLNAGRQWFQIRHVFNAYPPGVRYIHYRHAGKDRKFWAGHYGVKMALPTVQFQMNNL
ncbi:FBXO6 [Mytilus coruscus]|uniref:FBXO6 n=1 Tax=Mytilus coruscus TaxID=42192 RepID=A0A6J7ZYM9_MYTCO|nr:FBXO6 [Mytilus coruscus]